MEKHVPILAAKYGISAAPMTPQMFGAAGKEHMEKYGESVLHGNKDDLTVWRILYLLENAIQHMVLLLCCCFREGVGGIATSE